MLICFSEISKFRFLYRDDNYSLFRVFAILFVENFIEGVGKPRLVLVIRMNNAHKTEFQIRYIVFIDTFLHNMNPYWAVSYLHALL